MEARSREYFFDLANQMRSVRESETPQWGKMTPQHMVEHVVGSWRISNGRAKVPLMVSADELVKRRAFLFSDTPYAKNIQNPTQSTSELPKLRKPSLEDAIDQLEDEMSAFFEYHSNPIDAIENHPVFGELNANEWLIFQQKHMEHHFAQFGIESNIK